MISDLDKIDLDKNVSQAELIEVIVKLQDGKSPESDGLSTEFYRCFLTKILNPLKNMIESALNKELPESLMLAIITLLKKLTRLYRV